MSETSDTPANDSTQNPFDFDRSKGNFSFPERHKFDAGYGLTEATIDYISDVKDEPDWIRHFRKNALAVFESKPMPTHWASPEIEKIDFATTCLTESGPKEAGKTFRKTSSEPLSAWECRNRSGNSWQAWKPSTTPNPPIPT